MIGLNKLVTLCDALTDVVFNISQDRERPISCVFDVILFTEETNGQLVKVLCLEQCVTQTNMGHQQGLTPSAQLFFDIHRLFGVMYFKEEEEKMFLKKEDKKK